MIFSVEQYHQERLCAQPVCVFNINYLSIKNWVSGISFLMPMANHAFPMNCAVCLSVVCFS